MLKQYNYSDFKLLESWITDAELLFQFAGTDFSYPLTVQQISDYQANHPDRCFYIGYTSDTIAFAFGEIIPQDNGIPRLARILIGDTKYRGQGLGRYFVELLIDECKRLYNIDTINLFVWDKNSTAIKCYQSVGFKYDVEKYKTLIHDNKSYNIHKMTYSKDTVL